MEGNLETYGMIDLEGFTLEWKPWDMDVVPHIGDLVCGVPNPEQPNSFQHWFVCSQEFMHTWALVMYETISKRTASDPIHHAILHSHILGCNDYLSWLLAHSSRISIPEVKEMRKRFRRVRTEPASQWVHLYSAMVLMLRYNELPTLENLPKRDDPAQSPPYWHIPKGWVGIVSFFTQVQDADD